MLSEKNTEELIVLEAIFPDTLQSIEDSETKYKILITATDQSEEYPDLEPLKFSIKSVTTSTKFPKQELESFLLGKSQQLTGEPQVYSLIMFAQDWLQDWSKIEIERVKIQEKLRIQQEIAELEAKFKLGTPVTKESFSEWNKKFLHEFELESSANTSTSKGKTGRELFESDCTLATSDIQLDDEKETVFEFNPSLYEIANLEDTSSSDSE